jgi:hypothetical protein
VAVRKTEVLNARSEVVAEVAAGEGYVVAISLRLETVVDAWRFQQAIDERLRSSGLRHVLVDARKALVSPPLVNESMWVWVNAGRSFDRLAILNVSPVLTETAKKKTAAIGTSKVNVFTSSKEAVAWLLGSAKS